MLKNTLALALGVALGSSAFAGDLNTLAEEKTPVMNNGYAIPHWTLIDDDRDDDRDDDDDDRNDKDDDRDDDRNDKGGDRDDDDDDRNDKDDDRNDDDD